VNVERIGFSPRPQRFGEDVGNHVKLLISLNFTAKHVSRSLAKNAAATGYAQYSTHPRGGELVALKQKPLYARTPGDEFSGRRGAFIPPIRMRRGKMTPVCGTQNALTLAKSDFIREVTVFPMRFPNFCPACGAHAPLPPNWREIRSFRAAFRHLNLSARGMNCPECNARLAAPPWGPLGRGLLLGVLATLALTGWRATSAPAPLPPFLPATGGAHAPAAPAPNASLSRETHRCGARTKKGTPCRRSVPGKTGYCWQHRKE
jgi:hypothetical protein